MDNNAIIKIQELGFQWQTEDPFLFAVHHKDFYPKGNGSMGVNPDALLGRHIGQDFVVKDGWRMYHGSKIPGFPGHPHRGFETVTVVREGFVDHADSLGASGRYSGGDVQWLTAGAGVQHSEMFPLINDDEKNTLELFQLWLNLPKSKKFTQPNFKMLWREDIPLYESIDSNDNKTKIEVVAGQLYDVKAEDPPPNSWASDANNLVAIWTITMQPNAIWVLPATEEGINRNLYFHRGSSLELNETKVAVRHGVKLKSNVKITLHNGKEEAHLLLLQARPIGEPVAQHGPFVMNTNEEIQQTFDDYHTTQFGGWPWLSNDPVHDKTKGRFAKYIDGREEIK